MVRDPRALAVVQALTGLARSLHQEVIAEGLETADQAEALVGLGIHAVQGYLSCPPVEHVELCRLAARGRCLPGLGGVVSGASGTAGTAGAAGVSEPPTVPLERITLRLP